FLENGKARLEVVRQSSRMVLRASVQPEPFGTITPGGCGTDPEKLSPVGHVCASAFLVCSYFIRAARTGFTLIGGISIPEEDEQLHNSAHRPWPYLANEPPGPVLGSPTPAGSCPR